MIDVTRQNTSMTLAPTLFMRHFVSRVAAATPMVVADRVRRYHDSLWIMCKVSRVNVIGRNPPIAMILMKIYVL